jgi:hypothetical protein
MIFFNQYKILNRPTLFAEENLPVNYIQAMVQIGIFWHILNDAEISI